MYLQRRTGPVFVRGGFRHGCTPTRSAKKKSEYFCVSACGNISPPAPPHSTKLRVLPFYLIARGGGRQRCNYIHFICFTLLLFLLSYLCTYLSFTPLTHRKQGNKDTSMGEGGRLVVADKATCPQINDESGMCRSAANFFIDGLIEGSC